MKQIQIMKKIMLLAGFGVYLYLLTKLILFKLGSVNIAFLIDQLQRTLQYPDRIFNRSVNVVPFKEISRGVQHMSLANPFEMTNITGNILAFIPLGMFIPMLFRHRTALLTQVFMLSLLLSLSFEVTQLVLYIGTFDVDDLILNTCGGVLGYGIYRLGSLLGRSRQIRKVRIN
ncbi:MAG: VanZ family protein [Candidatus Pristimantibacillus sp.]